MCLVKKSDHNPALKSYVVKQSYKYRYKNMKEVNQRLPRGMITYRDNSCSSCDMLSMYNYLKFKTDFSQQTFCPENDRKVIFI